MGDLHIRRARPADLEVLVRGLGQRDFFDDRLSRQDKNLGMLLIAWQGVHPLGVVYLWLEDAEEVELRVRLPYTPILNHLEVHPDRRGTGIGTKLIEAAERRLRKLRYDQVALAVEVTNLRAARLYERLGYKEWAHSTVRCFPLNDGDEELHVEVCHVMTKALSREM